MWYIKPKDELYHHGIKGQKWGVRRFQNEDGSYTEAGRKRYKVEGKERYKVVNTLLNSKDPDSVDIVKILPKKQKEKLDRYRTQAKKISEENTRIEYDLDKKLSQQFGGKKAYELTPEEFKLYDQRYQKEWRRIFGDPQNADMNGRKYFNEKTAKLAKEIVGKYSDVPIKSVWTGDTYTAEEYVRLSLNDTF